jgi:kynurenine formamidase
MTATTTETFREIGARLRNWGRWGEDDEIGTVNFITPDKVAAAAALVRRGMIFSLGIPFAADGPQPGDRGRINPLHLMRETGEGQDFPGGCHFTDDYVTMPLQCATQWDSLAHIYYDDHLYNGYPASTVDAHGAQRNSIDKQGRGIAGRGVLLDVARLAGVDHLEAGHVITGDDLEAACAAHGVTVGTGDIVLVRTGWRRVFTETRDARAFMGPEPGLGLSTCEWLHDKEVAAICSDNWAVEVLPTETGDALPVHCVLIRDLGLTLGEMLDLEELADDCAADGVHEFFFTAPPIKFAKAVGSPINPLAIK